MLEQLDSGPPMPENHLSVPLPGWLTDVEAWEAACAHDRSVLGQVLEEVRAMSGNREQAKVKHLLYLA
ncbi:hypothetical protein [Halorhodospira halophila]|uniref:hypothetical protein n=1 Tax=Halorhodospira halophila TaxID=1053 RepID=UPI0002D67EBA|nr:hypothetical protein [Halorhodospira halophila]MBK1729403.1 hypothetical protein [Halorhodospira halophila]